MLAATRAISKQLIHRIPEPEKGMSTRFFTNAGTNTLLAKLEGVFHHNSDIERFDALVGYLRASGYFALRPHLEKVPRVRILVGIDVDEIVADYHKRGLLFLADPAKALDDFQDRLKRDIQKQQLENAHLRSRNQALAAEIEALKKGTSIEDRARRDMGMIRKDETFVLIVDEQEKASKK